MKLALRSFSGHPRVPERRRRQPLLGGGALSGRLRLALPAARPCSLRPQTGFQDGQGRWDWWHKVIDSPVCVCLPTTASSLGLC